MMHTQVKVRIAQDEDREARRLVSDLHTPRPAIYWTDMLLSALTGWGAFAAAIVFQPFSWRMIVASVIAVFALYRGLCFLHEISHLRQSAVRGFETAWNLLFGVPMLMPSFIYVGVHQNHHKLSTYGTDQDPEYLPFSGRRLMIVLFSLESLLLPVFLMIRLLLLSPFGLLSSKVHRWLETRASALCMNVRYVREVQAAVSRKMIRWEVVTLAVWYGLAALAAFRVLPWRCFAVWYLVSAVVSFINTLRTLGAHRYTSDGKPLDRDAQLGDSIDTPGAFWTELWAPVGLRYHALHHYFPGIPYHNLNAAYLRLIRGMPDSRYRQATNPSLPWSLRTLYRGR
ncbi:MAG TPA: fatty acid desaturase [Bryobacteraceae bacterium]|jgi:fatty acid desaturase